MNGANVTIKSKLDEHKQKCRFYMLKQSANFLNALLSFFDNKVTGSNYDTKKLEKLFH